MYYSSRDSLSLFFFFLTCIILNLELRNLCRRNLELLIDIRLQILSEQHTKLSVLILQSFVLLDHLSSPVQSGTRNIQKQLIKHSRKKKSNFQK